MTVSEQTNISLDPDMDALYKSPYADAVQLAYYICAKSDWSISSKKLDLTLYIIALCYAGEFHKLLTLPLFKVDFPFLVPINEAVKQAIGYQKIVKHYKIQLWPPRIYVPTVDDFNLSKAHRKYVDALIELMNDKTESQLFSISMENRYHYYGKNKKKFIDSGEIGLKDLETQYHAILKTRKGGDERVKSIN